ncbi:restriction endonuclease subunit S [Novosphingobium sp. PP1Y]|uniref:restriction endonuclease subunit S n=1 Tax=Novosphingobium sp. PP1Y TaxID=702113 RepID=UPI00020EE7FE|nr:restriction endonuclease subunit S [Novosphingobium sp. PP1Y]CCA91251.1 putative type I restriction-modification system specificity subunit [Novosphingobium sp. PP1Y]
MSFREAGIRLIDCVHKTPTAQLVGYPYVAIPQMKNGRVDFSDARRISHADFVEWTKKARPQVHDVVLSRRTNPGVTATFGTDVDFALGQNLVLLRADGDVVNPEFLRWLVVCPDWWAEIEKYNNVGAVFDSLKCADVPNFRLPIPPKPVQFSISQLLGSIDDKIELNRRMNETLEAMAQAIFRDWFVDFGPVRRKMAGVIDPVAIMGGLTPDPTDAAELAALFPMDFEVSDFPIGWDVKPVIDQANWVNGAAYKKMHFVAPGEGLPVIKIAELKAGVTSTTGFTNTDLGSRYRIDDGELLFSWSGNPDTSIDTFIWTGGPAWLNQHIFAVRPNGTRTLGFLFAMLKYLNPTFAEIARDKQTTGLGHVTKEDLKRLRVVVPPKTIETAFDMLMTPIFQKLQASLLENRTLAETRDYLLPRLMSGEVRVGYAAQEIAA